VSAFTDLRVLDVTGGLAGGLAAMMLSDFGARTLRIEPPDAADGLTRPGDVMRGRGKRRVTIDLDEADGRDRLAELIAGADVALFDLAPGRLEALGLDGATLSARHPRLVHAWLPPFGMSGPWSGLPEHHAMLTGLTGMAFRQGGYANQPIWHVTPMVLHGQGLMAAAAIAAALRDRLETGLGQTVVVSGAHASAEIAGPVGPVNSTGMMQGHPLGGSPSYRLYPCADGQWLFLGTLFPHFFDKAIDALSLRERAALAPPTIDLGRLIEDVFLERPRAAWLELLTAHGVPVAAVDARDDWLASEPIGEIGMRVERAHPEVGMVIMPGVPVRLANTPGEAGPLMGEASADDLAVFSAARLPSPKPVIPRDQPPLAGVRVLDLGTVIAGAYAGTILANFGADVIKVESADGDPFRPYGPGFSNHNRGKRGLGLNLKDPEGRQAFLDMARSADVVLDNYRLGVRARLGIDYPILREINPRIISCSINAYGSTGSEAHLPGFDPLLQARSGMMAAQGGAGQEPVFHTVPINDVATAAMGAFGVIAALVARERTGVGQNVETSLAAQSAFFQSDALTTWSGAPTPSEGERDCIGVSALERYYLCADGWITLAIRAPVQAEALRRILGAADWSRRFPDVLNQSRRGELATEIGARIRGRARDELLTCLAAEGVPATPVFTTEEARGEAWLWEAGFFDVSDHPMWGELIMCRGYAEFVRGGAAFARVDPGLGEHTVEVLRDFGFDIERIRRLAERRLIFRR